MPLNPYMLIAALGALLVSFVSGGVLGWHEKTIRVPAELTQQQQADANECEKVQQLTKGANDVLQKDISAITAQLNTYKLRQPPSCVRVTSRADHPKSGAKHAGSDGAGINSDWLREYAATAEQYRSEVDVCSNFLNQERQLLGEQKNLQP